MLHKVAALVNICGFLFPHILYSFEEMSWPRHTYMSNMNRFVIFYIFIFSCNENVLNGEAELRSTVTLNYTRA